MFKQPDGRLLRFRIPAQMRERRHMAAMGQHEILLLVERLLGRGHRIIETAEINECKRQECLQRVKHRIERAQAYGRVQDFVLLLRGVRQRRK